MPTSRSVAVILAAAGKSRRFGAPAKKIFSPLRGRMVWEHAAERVGGQPQVASITIAIDPDDRPVWETTCAPGLKRLGAELVDGGAERVDSVARALRAIPDVPFVAVHDAARPLLRGADWDALMAAADAEGAAILATRLRGTVKRQDAEGRIGATVDRRDLWEALTPQIFRTDVLRAAYERWRGFPATDDAQLVERAGFPVRLVEGSPTNIKITVADDLAIAEALMALENRFG